ncbi:MAG: hypothetical protein QXD62_03355 [Candidatus Woesearchaeota archaeon]
MKSILNFEITNIEANKYGNADKVEIKQGVSIRGIDLSSNVSNNDFVVLRIGFNYVSEYVNLGLIKIQGNVFVLEEKKKGEEIVKKWEENKAVEKNLLESVINFAYKNCLIESIHISQRLGLPLPIPLPSIKFEVKENKEEKKEEKEQKKEKEK